MEDSIITKIVFTILVKCNMLNHNNISIYISLCHYM